MPKARDIKPTNPPSEYLQNHHHSTARMYEAFWNPACLSPQCHLGSTLLDLGIWRKPEVRLYCQLGQTYGHDSACALEFHLRRRILLERRRSRRHRFCVWPAPAFHKSIFHHLPLCQLAPLCEDSRRTEGSNPRLSLRFPQLKTFPDSEIYLFGFGSLRGKFCERCDAN